MGSQRQRKKSSERSSRHQAQVGRKGGLHRSSRTMEKRINHRDMSPAQKAAFINAFLALKNSVDSVLHPGRQKRYDDFVEVHKNAMTGPDMFMPMPHGSPLFFPWHRIMLRQFELELQRAVNDPTVTLPYWDWNMNGLNSPFVSEFLGGDGDAAQNNRVQSGSFAFATGQFDIRVWDEGTGDQGLRREFGDDATAWLPDASDIAAGIGRTPYWPGAASFERVAEGVLHNPVHRWIGGNMAEATSPNDPVFFLHHAFLDLLWERWKLQHPTIDPYLPTTSSQGLGLDATLVFNAPGNPPPWSGSWTVSQVVDPANLGYEYA